MRIIIRTLATATALTLGALAVPAAHAAKPHWRVTISASRATTTVGHKVWLTGKVSKAAAGKLVVLQEKFAADRPWRDQRNALVHVDGSYKTWDTPTANHRRLYRVVMPATKKRAKGVSKSVAVKVYAWTPLTSMASVNEMALYKVASASIDTVVFPTSLEARVNQDGPNPQSVEFNLNHKCTRFRGTFGLSDNSQTNSQASVTASADGAPWFAHTYSLGQSDHNRFDFETPPLKVHFETKSVVDGQKGLGMVGTPEVFCTQ